MVKTLPRMGTLRNSLISNIQICNQKKLHSTNRFIYKQVIRLLFLKTELFKSVPVFLDESLYNSFHLQTDRGLC